MIQKKLRFQRDSHMTKYMFYLDADKALILAMNWDTYFYFSIRNMHFGYSLESLLRDSQMSTHSVYFDAN